MSLQVAGAQSKQKNKSSRNGGNNECQTYEVPLIRLNYLFLGPDVELNPYHLDIVHVVFGLKNYII